MRLDGIVQFVYAAEHVYGVLGRNIENKHNITL